MRRLDNVIEKMILQIPQHEEDFLRALESIRSNFLYAAPEQELYFWNKTQDILNEFLWFKPNTSSAWAHNVVKIWTNSPN